MSLAFDWRAIDCVILDMDGTLLDLHFDHLVWDELLPRRYAEMHALDEQAARADIAHTLDTVRGTLAWYCLDHWERALGIDVTTLEAELEAHIGLRPGAQAFLDWIGDRGLRRILATNAHPRSLARKLARTGIASRFDDVVSAHTLGSAKEESNFWQALERRCGFDPERVLFIDDNSEVLASAARHGLRHCFGIAQPSSQGAPLEGGDFRRLVSFVELTGVESARCQARG